MLMQTFWLEKKNILYWSATGEFGEIATLETKSERSYNRPRKSFWDGYRGRIGQPF